MRVKNNIDMDFKTYQRLFDEIFGQPSVEATSVLKPVVSSSVVLQVNPHVPSMPRLNEPKLLALGPAKPKVERLCNDFWDCQAKLKEAVNIDSPNVKKIGARIAKLKKVLREKHNLNIGNLQYTQKYGQFGLFQKEFKISPTLWFKRGEPPVNYISQNTSEFVEGLSKPQQKELTKSLAYISNLIKGQKIKIGFVRFYNEISVLQKKADGITESIFKRKNIKDVIPQLKNLTLVGEVATKSNKLILPE